MQTDSFPAKTGQASQDATLILRQLPDGGAMRTAKPAKPGSQRKKQRAGAVAANRLPTPVALRIAQRRDELGLTNAEVAKRASIGVNVLYKILRGDEDNPRFATISALCRALDCQFAWLIGSTDDADLRMATIPLIGQAEVGVFRTEKPQQSGAIADSVPLDQRFINKPRFGIIVADGSLDEVVHAPDAAKVVGLVIAMDRDMAVENGKIYLVHRANTDGQIETSFRRAAVYHDAYEFAPLFLDAAKNQRHTLRVSKEDFDAGQAIEIGGLFYGVTCRYL